MPRLNARSILLLTVQLSNLVGAGIPLLTALRSAATSAASASARKVLAEITTQIESGMSLSQALGRYPESFAPWYLSTVRAAEASGQLEGTLTELARLIERMLFLRQRVRRAVSYPIFLLVVAGLIAGYIITMVIPEFVKMFSRAGTTLPGPTIFLYGIGEFIRAFWQPLAVTLVLAVFGLSLWRHSSPGRLLTDTVMSKTPGFAELIRDSAIARFTQTLGALLTSGAPLLESIKIASDVVSNWAIRQRLLGIQQGVQEGEGIAEALAKTHLFPSDAMQLITAGEQSGRLDVILRKVADLYDEAVEDRLDQLTQWLEPVLILVMGATVALLMASLLLPMLELVGKLR